MYGDQFGEFVCGYWDLKGYVLVWILVQGNLQLAYRLQRNNVVLI